MVELIGDPCFPSDFGLPQLTTAQIDVLSGTLILSGTMVYNITLGKAEVWNGAAWETITSVAR